MKIEITVETLSEARDQYGGMRKRWCAHLLEIESNSATDVECRIDGDKVNSEIFKVALAMCELGRVRDS